MLTYQLLIGTHSRQIVVKVASFNLDLTISVLYDVDLYYNRTPDDNFQLLIYKLKVKVKYINF